MKHICCSIATGEVAPQQVGTSAKLEEVWLFEYLYICLFESRQVGTEVRVEKWYPDTSGQARDYRKLS